MRVPSCTCTLTSPWLGDATTGAAAASRQDRQVDRAAGARRRRARRSSGSVELVIGRWSEAGVHRRGRIGGSPIAVTMLLPGVTRSTSALGWEERSSPCRARRTLRDDATRFSRSTAVANDRQVANTAFDSYALRLTSAVAALAAYLRAWRRDGSSCIRNSRHGTASTSPGSCCRSAPA